MLELSEVLRIRREEQRERNRIEQQKRYEKMRSFEKREQRKEKVVIGLVLVFIVSAFVLFHSITNKDLQSCIKEKGESYCVSKLG